jgi:CRISPR-associated exonuclease Cas4
MTKMPEYPFIVENVKQFLYCPRVVFYERCMPGVRPRTYSMDAGHEDHLEARQNARRRSFAQMGLENGKREFDVDLMDAGLNLHGRLDEIVTTDAGEMIPVEYKGTAKISDNHRFQVAAYALLLEAVRFVEVNRAYIYLIPLRKARPIPVHAAMKQQVRDILSELSTMVSGEIMPPPTPVRSRCGGCEFRRFCNDV